LDFSTIFYAFSKFTAENSNKVYKTAPRISTKPPETSLSSPMESLAVVKGGRRYLTGQIHDARVAIVGEKRGNS
jgi:hypothetical protein